MKTRVLKSKLQKKLLYAAGLCLGLSACSYRFSNQYLRPPVGIKTAFIEATFDTSAKGINHQVVTKAFENEIAKDGKMRIVRNDNADLYIRLSLTTVERNQYDIGLTNTIKRQDFEDGDVKIQEFPDLKKPGRFANKENLRAAILVEFWNTSTRKKMHTYSQQLSHSYNILDTNTDRDNRFLRYEETFYNHLSKISNVIASNALKDFYRKTM